MDVLKQSAQHVQDFLREHGFANVVVELPDSTRTAAEAATAVGCSVGQIAKSILFRRADTDTPVLVIASGTNRVSEERIAEWLGAKLLKADADFVRAHAGYVIGGVPPIAHVSSMAIAIDQDLLQYDAIWAAAGHPKAVFRLTPDELLEMTKGCVMGVA
ncbi:YbaK/EbsC family protein [Ferroacidibacillus organovorans]|uniref:YbaK/aminoacyl-tRNA synthetase-associated domain-containing protein n=1 Tax=Ferroacidibacillus organovorans TaxID=1765683 RepID=A0A1V4EWU8_9BACL|nr:YbaK/EbsC family protein [Ferroacidibacillus organovorans]OPG17417.1 hypothetical protein B2M26_01395 [Ferroacidibacillus organovorans]